MAEPSSRQGMGAIPYTDSNESGTTFRVWGNLANAVCVSGTFNNWSTDKHPLASEGNGYWSADIPEAKINDRYRYVIQSDYIQGFQWRTDPYCKCVDNDTDNGSIVSAAYDWGDDHFSFPGWNELVVYELHVGSFYRTKEIPGDFSAIIDKLGYLSDLGINVIEIMPVSGFPDEYSLGYDPTFPFDIESNYGGPTEFKDFIRAAHKKGIAVILDIVINHFGGNDLVSSLYRFDGWSENGRNGMYFYNDWRFYTPFGDRPDYGRDEVRHFLMDNVMMWLEEYHVDGLRFDSTVNIRNVYGHNNDPANDIADGWNLMQAINNTVDAKIGWKLTIAEDLQDNEWITRSTSSQGAGFDSQWDGYYYGKMIDVIVAANDADRNMFDVRDAIVHRFETDICKRVTFINNHDQCAAINNNFRLPDRIWLGHADSWASRKRSTLAASILFTTPGIPMIFQGDEFLEWGSWDPKTVIDWSKKELFAGILDLHKLLIRLRRNWFNNSAGLTGQLVNVFHINDTDKVIAYHRWQNGGPGDDVIVVANFGNTSYDSYTIGFPRNGAWYVRFNSDWNGYGNDFGNHPGYDTTAGPAVGGSTDGLPCAGNKNLLYMVKTVFYGYKHNDI